MAEKKTSGAKWIFILLLLMVLGVAAGLSAAWISRRNSDPGPLQKVQLKDEILSFAIRHVPSIHSGIVRIDRELVLIEKELLRLSDIEKSFPNRRTIIDAERSEWNRVRRSLASSVSKIQRGIETLYITYMVNPDKGKELIQKEKESLSAEIGKTLEESRPYTSRLKSPPPKGWIDRIRAKIRG